MSSNDIEGNGPSEEPVDDTAANIAELDADTTGDPVDEDEVADDIPEPGQDD